jgi:hypothetical protein
LGSGSDWDGGIHQPVRSVPAAWGSAHGSRWTAPSRRLRLRTRNGDGPRASKSSAPRRICRWDPAPRAQASPWAVSNIGHSHLLLLRLRDPAPVALSGRRPCHGGARPHAASPPPRRSATLRRSPASSPGPARRLPRCLRSRLLSKPSREPSPSPPPPPHPPPRPHHAAPAQPPQLPPGRGPRYCRAALPSRARHLGSLCARVIWVVSASSLL